MIRKVNSEVFRREYKRINNFRILLDKGRLSLKDIRNCYLSWRGTYSKFDSGYDILDMDLYFRYIFNLNKNFELPEDIDKSKKKTKTDKKKIYRNNFYNEPGINC